MAPELTQAEANRRVKAAIAKYPVLEAFTYGEEPKPKKARKKRQKMPKRLAAHEAYLKCLKRRRKHRGRRRCTSLFYAGCIKQDGTTMKSNRCKKIMRAKIH